MTRYFIFVFVVLFMSFPAFAKDITEADVKRYLQTMSDIYTTDQVDQKKVVDFIKAYVDDNAEIHITTKVDGAGKAETKTFGKDDIMALNSNGDVKTLDSSAFYDIQAINVHDDARFAEVSYKFWQNSSVKNKADKGKFLYVDYRTESLCRELVKLDGDTLKVLKSDCTVDVSYGKPYTKSN